MKHKPLSFIQEVKDYLKAQSVLTEEEFSLLDHAKELEEEIEATK